MSFDVPTHERSQFFVQKKVTRAVAFVPYYLIVFFRVLSAKQFSFLVDSFVVCVSLALLDCLVAWLIT